MKTVILATEMKGSSCSFLLAAALLLVVVVDTTHGFSSSSNSLPTTTPLPALNSNTALFSTRLQQEQQRARQQSVFERERERKWAAAQAAARQQPYQQGPQAARYPQQYPQPQNQNQLARYPQQPQLQQNQLARYPKQQQQVQRGMMQPRGQQFMPQGDRGMQSWKRGGLFAGFADWVEQAKWTLKNSFNLNNNAMMAGAKRNNRNNNNQKYWSPTTPQYYGPGGGAANRAPLPQTGPQNRLLFDDPRYSSGPNPQPGSRNRGNSNIRQQEQQWSPNTPPPITASSLSRTWFDATPAQATQNYYIYERPVTNNKSWSPQGVLSQQLGRYGYDTSDNYVESNNSKRNNGHNWFTSFESLDEKLLKQRRRFDYSQVPASSQQQYWTPTTATLQQDWAPTQQSQKQKYYGLEPSSSNYQKRNWNPLGGSRSYSGGAGVRGVVDNAAVARLERRLEEMERRQKQQQQQQQRRATKTSYY